MKKRLGNWIYYYKWYVVAALLVLAAAGRWAGSALGILEKKPDLQAACIARRPLSAETVRVLEEELAAYAGDYNGDGAVKAVLHTYLCADEDSTAEARQSAAASEISLAGDINDCESYLFLMEDPARVQLDWQILAQADGSCPDPSDYAAGDKVLPLTALPLDLSGVTDEEDLAVLHSLQAGRRCFYTDRTCRHREELDAFWDALTGSR